MAILLNLVKSLPASTIGSIHGSPSEVTKYTVLHVCRLFHTNESMHANNSSLSFKVLVNIGKGVIGLNIHIEVNEL